VTRGDEEIRAVGLIVEDLREMNDKGCGFLDEMLSCLL
jgi:hypothetical protein